MVFDNAVPRGYKHATHKLYQAPLSRATEVHEIRMRSPFQRAMLLKAHSKDELLLLWPNLYSPRFDVGDGRGILTLHE